MHDSLSPKSCIIGGQPTRPDIPCTLPLHQTPTEHNMSDYVAWGEHHSFILNLENNIGREHGLVGLPPFSTGTCPFPVEVPLPLNNSYSMGFSGQTSSLGLSCASGSSSVNITAIEEVVDVPTRSLSLEPQLIVPSPHVTQPAIVQDLKYEEIAVGCKWLHLWPSSLSKRTCTIGIQRNTSTIGDNSPLSDWKGTLKKKKIVARKCGIRLRSHTTSITETAICLEAGGISQDEEAGLAMPPLSMTAIF